MHGGKIILLFVTINISGALQALREWSLTGKSETYEFLLTNLEPSNSRKSFVKGLIGKSPTPLLAWNGNLIESND